MQEYKDDKIVKAEMEKHIKELAEDVQRDLQSGFADSATIALISIGDEFEIKRLRFRVTRKHNRGRITAKLVGIDVDKAIADAVPLEEKEQCRKQRGE